MTVAAILNDKGNGVISAPAGAILKDVCDLLLEHRIGAVLVLKDDGAIAGILSERDIVRAIGREGVGALTRPTTDFMTRKVETCSEDITVNKAMARMTKGRFRHLPVVRDGKPVGVISIGDVVKWRLEQVEREAEEMRSYIAMA